MPSPLAGRVMNCSSLGLSTTPLSAETLAANRAHIGVGPEAGE